MPTLLRPLWLTGHVLVAASAAVMVKLGLWQWGRARDLDSIQNYSYAVEWWVFALLTVVGWAKICHDELIPDPDAGVLFGAVEPAVSSAEIASWDTDPEVAAWNAQFRALHLRHALKEAGLTEADVARELAAPDRPPAPDRLPDPDRRALQ